MGMITPIPSPRGGAVQERKGVLRRSTRRTGAFEYRLRLRRERRGSGHPSGTAGGRGLTPG